MTISVVACPTPILQFFDNRGNPLVGGTVLTQVGGVNYPTYQDSAGVTALPNPIPLNSRGEISDATGTSRQLFVVSNTVYTFTLSDANGNVIDQAPYVNGIAINQALIGQLLWPRTAEEIAAGVTPANYAYPPGVPERYGAVGDGVTDDTAALTNCIAANDTVIFTEDKIYGVTTVAFPLNGPHNINFNGAWIRGISTTPQNAIVVFAAEGTTVFDWRVDGNFSQNYLCGTWWYNSTSSSQYNVFFGVKHRYLGGVQTSSGTTVRAMIYGALVGQSSVSNAQSENQIFGWRTRGCQNPFYSNHSNGVLQMTDPIFVCLAEDWPATGGVPNAPWSYANGRALECVNGLVNVSGGEIQAAESGMTYAAELANFFGNNIIIEIAEPIRINNGTVGTAVFFNGGRILQDQLAPCFTINSGVTGALTLSAGFYVNRPAGTGAFDNNPMIDASAAGSPFEVLLSDTQSYEYRWTQVGANVQLVKLTTGGSVRFRNHQMSMTAADPNLWMLNTGPIDSLLEVAGFDPFGYSTTGWNLTTDFGSGMTMTATTNAGPTGYNANQITLAAPSTVQGIASFGNPTSVTTLKSTALTVRPGELYWLSAWANITSGTGVHLGARFFTSAGAVVSDVVVADSGSIGSAVWSFVEGPLVVPATAAFMCPCVLAISSTIEVTDMRLMRAS